MHVFDLIGIHVRCGGLDGRGQVVNDFALRRRLPRLGDRIAHLEREVWLSGAEDFGRIFIQPLCLRVFSHASHHALGAFDGDLFDLFAIHVEDDAAKAWRASVVQVNHGAFCTRGSFDGALDEFGAGLCQGDDCDVIGDEFVVDKFPHKIKVCL